MKEPVIATMDKGSSKDFLDVKVSILVSLLAWPTLYIFNTGFERVSHQNRTFVMMITGFALIITIPLALVKITRSKEWLGLVFKLFLFTSMIDLIIAFEYYGLISGFMSHYLEMGEPYLHSSWGCAIALFDGTGFYIIYLLLIHQISNGSGWRSLGIYWASAILNSMIVLLFGVFAGRHAPTFCTFLNLPYAILPIHVLIGCFAKNNKKDSLAWMEEPRRRDSTVVDNVLDAILLLGFLGSIWITFVKGMLSFGSTFPLFLSFLRHEPALDQGDPAPFAKIQNILFLFYIFPIQLFSTFYIFKGKSKKKPQILWDLGLIQAGVVLQGQFSFIAAALDPMAPTTFRSSPYDILFWIHNLTLLIVPQLFLYQLRRRHVVSPKEGSSQKDGRLQD